MKKKIDEGHLKNFLRDLTKLSSKYNVYISEGSELHEGGWSSDKEKNAALKTKGQYYLVNNELIWCRKDKLKENYWPTPEIIG